MRFSKPLNALWPRPAEGEIAPLDRAVLSTVALASRKTSGRGACVAPEPGGFPKSVMRLSTALVTWGRNKIKIGWRQANRTKKKKPSHDLLHLLRSTAAASASVTATMPTVSGPAYLAAVPALRSASSGRAVLSV